MGAVAHRDPPPLRAVMLDLRSKHQMLFPQRTGCGLQKKGLTMGGGINGEVKGDNKYYVTGNPTACCQSLNASANAFPNQRTASE